MMWHHVPIAFQEARAEKGKVSSYEGFDLQAFNDAITHPYGYIKLMCIIGDGKNTVMVNM